MRYKYLDVAKGITLTFVMMAHSCWFPYGIELYCTPYFVAFFLWYLVIFRRISNREKTIYTEDLVRLLSLILPIIYLLMSFIFCGKGLIHGKMP